MSTPNPTTHFIGEPIEVIYSEPPIRFKDPACPQAFIWRGKNFKIMKLISQKTDFSRHGSYKRNMSEEHRSRAERIGSWGVGRYYFRIVVQDEQEFEIYYDRSPQNIDDRYGGWYLLQEYKKN
ncbi:MAG: hypothetical protein GYA18_02730 [Chloroflexi bacterium]|nr:hypothetical protein [Chloroflexota bacterium]